MLEFDERMYVHLSVLLFRSSAWHSPDFCPTSKATITSHDYILLRGHAQNLRKHFRKYAGGMPDPFVLCPYDAYPILKLQRNSSRRMFVSIVRSSWGLLERKCTSKVLADYNFKMRRERYVL
jgi:hypothetical protein